MLHQSLNMLQNKLQAVQEGGKDARQKPYTIFRIKVDAEPVALK